MVVLSVFQLAKFQYRAEVWNTDVSTSASSLEKVVRFGDIVVSKIKNLKPEHADFLAQYNYAKIRSRIYCQLDY